MKITFVRHGITQANIEDRAMGSRVDEPLALKGVDQAIQVAQELKDLHFDILASSPLRRAKQTADLIAEVLKLEVITIPELAERDNGSLSGKLWSDIKTETANEMSLERLHTETEIDFSKWDGESIADVRERLEQFIEYSKKHCSDRKVLAVTHAGVLRVLHAMQGKKLLEPKNTGVYELDV